MSDNTDTARPRLLLVAFECSPKHGSEWANGWNRALQAALRYDTWVITHGGPQEYEIRDYLAAHEPIPNLHFEFVPCAAFDKHPVHVGGRLWLAYHDWQRDVLKRAQELQATRPFDLIHHVTNTGFREPGYLWQLDAPFVWGPIGGLHNYPWRFLSEAGLRGALTEGVRSIANSFQLHCSLRGRRAARRAKAILAANSTACQRFYQGRGVLPHELLDVGIASVAEQPRPARSGDEPLRILWSGQFVSRKALTLLLKALAQLPADFRYVLRVVGGGPLEAQWKQLAERLGVNAHIEWAGWLPHAQARQQYDWADVFVFTSLRDNSGTVMLEAMGAGVPVICLDHQGARDIVTPECGIKIALSTPRKVVADMATALVEFGGNYALRSRLGNAAYARAKKYLWDNLGRQTAIVYREVLNDTANAQQTAPHPLQPRSTIRPKLLAREAAVWGIGRAAAALQATRGRRPGNGFGILTYHRVTENVSGFPAPTWNITPAQLEKQLAGLLRRGFQPWSLSDLLQARAAGVKIPAGVFAVTFDDGYENNFTDALPVLEKLGVPATIFLATAFVDQSEPFPFDDWKSRGQRGVPVTAWRPLSASECGKLLDSGMIELGTHTHTHQKFLGRPEDFRRDMQASIDMLHEQFGVRHPVLAFPHGIHDQEMLDIVRELDIPSALTTVPGLIDLASNPLGWGRFSVESHDTAATLAGKLGGWYTEITHTIRTFGRGKVQSTAPAEHVDAPLPASPVEVPAEQELVGCD
ncbi:MAG TPA: glycosyltransferase [Pirellulales bacterium]|jgi:glycosyltransferase involved in cell wall biosynthesis/peptidoglycan/xylan/chitin deacetylase (PgdA/CDA1 family)